MTNETEKIKILHEKIHHAMKMLGDPEQIRDRYEDAKRHTSSPDQTVAEWKTRIEEQLVQILHTTDFQNAEQTSIGWYLLDAAPMPFSPLSNLLFDISHLYNGLIPTTPKNHW